MISYASLFCTSAPRNLLSACLLAGLCWLGPAVAAASYPTLNDTQLEWIGQQIFNNECNRRVECLTAWNAGEDFPSLGIGHFIWYRQGQQEIYQESFPHLLIHLESSGVRLPAWLPANDYRNPWPNRDSFLDDFEGERLQELRALLQTTVAEQTAFIVSRFSNALDAMLETSTPSEQYLLQERFYRIAASHPPYGMYALIDYVNFKGEGVAMLEQYQGQGWGLKQVLLNMQGSQLADSEREALEAFARSAREVLQQRVHNAPPERNEQRWLEGWFNRTRSYVPPASN